MTQELLNLFNLIPEHLKKENTLKFIECLKPCFEYVENLLIEDEGMSNIDKAHGEYLDFIGYRNGVQRNGMTDEEFRPFIMTTRFKALNAPTTKNLINLTEQLAGYTPAEIIFYPNGEPASQYFKFIVPYTTDLSKFPDYNEIIDAGARMYYDIVSKAGKTRYRPEFTAGLHQLNMFIEEIEVPTGGKKL